VSDLVVGGQLGNYLTDFGIAKSNVDSERLTRTGVPIGTVGYAAGVSGERRGVGSTSA
jgi:hypothetical protein